ncbi:MAG: conjugal transfer protein TraW [Pantoea sp.]|uniref:conjugal transfer protein TraW n=1 Tax=Erwiniaceae TaxID=1903409 RepID=UPI002897E8CF|nr:MULTISPECIES: conjugal transfer protein TraW [Pantoea]MDU5837912.1 conjugal transfer protein TraW [Pantoea sp.]MDU6438308.1 conjugal transfer protein TraW [Pantoea sp.]
MNNVLIWRPKGCRLIAACVLAAMAPNAMAYTVDVVSSVPVERQVMPALQKMQVTLAEILSAETETGTAVVQSADKTATAITEAARTQREAENFNRQADRLEKARASYTVPDSICSESASGTAAQVSQATRAAASKLAGGGGVSSAAVRETLASLPVTPRQGSYRSALIHSAYCTAEEAKLYGGTGLCPGVSSLPGGDIEARSLYDGAGEAGKAPELTFTQAQTDAAMAYVNNSTKLDAGRTPGKGEIQSATGQEYQGLLTQYKAMQSAAMQPQLDMVAASQPQDATQAALTEARQAPSAESYFQQTASAQAKQTGTMSEREFESFEVGRRYANTAWVTDLQGMDGDNLTREVARQLAAANWLALGIKNELRQANIISGQQLALAAKAEYGPQLQALSAQMSAGVSTQ